MQSEANMLRAARKFFTLLKRPRANADDLHKRHLAWDRACRARGMTAREQADELQIRCAWVRLRAKASAKVMRNPARSREILDRIAADEAKTLAAIGGAELAAAFLRAYKAAEPLEILSEEAAFVVRAETTGALARIIDAPSVVPALPGEPKSKRARSRQKKAATA
jgi:hypothetical protein